MMKRARMRGAAAVSAAAASILAAPAADDRPGLREGAIAGEVIVAPADVVVVDTERSVVALRGEGVQAPMVMKLDPGAGENTSARLATAFARNREEFVHALEAAYGRRQLDEREMEAIRFRDFCRSFRGVFPVSLALGQTWARGFDGAGTRDRYAAVAKAVLAEYLVADLRPVSEIYIAKPLDDRPVRTWTEVEGETVEIDPGTLLTMQQAAREIRRRLEPGDVPVGGFLAGLLEPNVVEDAFLTGLLLRDRFSDRIELRAVSRGEIVARPGEPVDRWAALTLAHLDRAGLEPATSSPAALESAPAMGSGARTGWNGRVYFWWIAGGIGGLFAAVPVVVGGFWLARRARRRARAGQLAIRPPDTPAAMRTALLPHLARELKDRLVGALFSQRNALLENEAAASLRIEELEERLARLQPAIAERIRGYEERIAALERELQEKDRETRDLIRAKLVLARRELENELARNRIRWN